MSPYLALTNPDHLLLAGLLCVQPAVEGGMSSWSDSLAAYEKLKQRRPDLAEVRCCFVCLCLSLATLPS